MMTVKIFNERYPDDKPYDERTHSKDVAFEVAKQVLKGFDEKVGPELFWKLVNAAAATAQKQHDNFLEAVREGKVSGESNTRGGGTRALRYRRRPTYTRVGTPGDGRYYGEHSIHLQQEYAEKGWYSVDLDHAKVSAAANFAGARAKLFHKVDEKLGKALGGRKQAVKKLTVGFSQSLPIQATVQVEVSDDTSFNVDISIRYNYSKLGTPYWQYPARFYDVIVEGQGVKNPSLKSVTAALVEAKVNA